MVSMVIDGTKLADELITCVTVHYERIAMAATLHGGLYFEGD